MGSVMMSGAAPNMTVPVTGIKGSDIAVGSIVKLMEDGVATDYLVVNQGIPSGSSLYDASCDGMWLFRKTANKTGQWNSSDVNDYENSTINSYLNNTFLNLFDATTRSAIKQVKIPYRAGSGYGTTITSGANGLSTKIFLLSSTEINLTNSWLPTNEGAKLDYFKDCNTSSDEKRALVINYLYQHWWLRTPICSSSVGSTNAGAVEGGGSFSRSNCTDNTYFIRPALVLPSTAFFDETTMLLKGVA